MTDLNKSHRIMGTIIYGLERGVEGKEGFEASLSRLHLALLSGHKPEYSSKSDFVNGIVADMEKYCGLVKARRNIVVEGSSREMATETEALESLKYAVKIAKDYLTPFMRRRFDFSDKVFHDIHDLGIAYVNAVTDSASEEYIPREATVDAKLRSTNLAKQASRTRRTYAADHVKKADLEDTLSVLSDSVSKNTTESYMRPYENVVVTPKKVSKKRKFTDRLIDGLTTSLGTAEKLEFVPDVIFPIATGGVELGIDVAIVYENFGFDPIVYPVMFSMKTRKHRHPWTANDEEFLRTRNHEGEKFLITEDWVTTGNTVRGVINELESSFPKEIRVATIKRDPKISRMPILDKYRFYVGQWIPYRGSKTDSIADQAAPESKSE